MRNMVVDMSVSLDGYIAAANDVPGAGVNEDGGVAHVVYRVVP